MTEDRLIVLLIRRLSGELIPEEAQELEDWAEEAPENRQFLNRNKEWLEKDIDRWRSIDPADGYAKWERYWKSGRRKARVLRITGWSVAASLVVAFIVGGLVDKSSPVLRPAPTAAMPSNQVSPGHTTAMLTLSNGQQILLDSTGNGEIALQGHTRLVKDDGGNLSYVVAGNDKTIPMTYNILTTPRSGQYQLTLPDGSRVWLNNVSSLRYPTAFLGKDRTVELTGEAYFEIAKDAAKPFIVKVRDESVEVLGTSFNVMAYSEEGGTETTLLTGAVRVKAGTSVVQLKPDEQAQVGSEGSLKVVRNVPSQDIISWKNGFFYFGRARFAAVMRQLARWYDIDVVYEGKEPDMEFGGKIDRSLSLNDLLKYLDKNQIQFRLEGRKLIVLPN